MNKMEQNSLSKPKLSRRQFLKISAVVGIAGMTTKFSLEAFSQPQVVSITRLLMGTVVNLTVIHKDPNHAQSAIRACLDKMQSLESLLSRFKPDSQLSILNREGKLISPNPHLVTLVLKSRELSELSQGAFDITVKPVIDAIQAGRLITDEEFGAVGYQNVVADVNQIAFLNKGMGITLDGIAKGYIVDCGVAVLQDYGFNDILVEAGGDLVAHGHSVNGDQWRISIAEPRPKQGLEHMPTFSVSNQAVATSGDYVQYYLEDKSLNHIIDPQSHTSPSELASVTIIAPTAMLADGLSTLIMVLGSKYGLQLLEQLPSIEGLLVSKDLQVFQTSNFPGT